MPLSNPRRCFTLPLPRILFVCSLLVLGCLAAQAQKVLYTEANKDELKQTEFEIIGKYNGQFLVYKQLRDKKYVSVYDAEMKLKSNEILEGIPDRLIAADFITYPDFSYMFFQHQKKGVVYMMMLKIDGNGKALTQPIELDTTVVGGMGSNGRIYSVLVSEDKQQLMLFRINTRNERRYSFKTLLFDKEITLRHTTKLELGMNDRNDFLTDFYLDNDGHLVFGRGLRPGSGENISRFFLVVKPAMADTFVFHELSLTGISLDEVKLRMDNFNNRYLFTGFYSKGKRYTNIEGICNAVFDKVSRNWVVRNVIPLDNELRADARGDNNIKSAFNDFYIKEIIIKKDGGFVVTAESIYQTSRGNAGFNRWDMMATPMMMNSMDFYGGGFGGFGGFGRGWRGNNFTRYHADNVVVCAFDKDGKLIMSNTIRKSQFDDESDATVSYQLINTGNALAFLYNDFDRRDVLLTYQMIDAEGKTSRPPTMKNLDRGYTFLPRLAKQVSGRQLIVPTLYRNYLVFAKVEF
ncbi:MAG: hypothetical protein EAY75_03005 [Bacteroidetes bacterium]|nr:MAG: hypothetical protein EAY75_03005 [Bacteroidota bacterium]